MNIMIASLMLLLFISAHTQIISSLENVTIVIFPITTLSIYQDPSSQFYPHDFFQSIEIANNFIYTLDSNNVIEIYSKLDPSIKIYTLNSSTNFTKANSLIQLSIDKQETIMALTSYQNQVLTHLVMDIKTNGIPNYKKTCGNITLTNPPAKVFINNNTIYSYLSQINDNDLIYVVNTVTDESYQFNLPFSNCKISISPNQQTAIFWNSNSRLYIYSVKSNFSLVCVFNLSLTSPKDKTNKISFSDDSNLIILQTDNQNPIRIINLTDYSVTTEITLASTIESATFLDPFNRFILIQGSNSFQIYDCSTQQLSGKAGPFDDSFITTDYTDNQLFRNGSSINCYGINITENNNTIISYPPTLEQPPTFKEKFINPTSQFYRTLNYSDFQNQTLQFLGTAISSANTVTQNIFSVIFSSPLAVQFLSFFNYFMLSSFYVLLNIRIPYDVFYYFSLFYFSCTSDVLTQTGLLSKIEPISLEKVTDSRALYFQITSDVYSANSINLFAIFINILLYEIVIFITGRGFKKLLKFHRTLIYLRIDVYWGLIISNMAPILLPWKYTVQGGGSNFISKINYTISCFLICLLTFLVAISFQREFQRIQKGNIGQRIRKALREWWVGYQNFIYPIFLLLNPNIFMVIIGASNIFVLYTSFHAKTRKLLMILKAAYPLIFQSCFLIFMISEDNLILVTASLTCLFIFFMGSAHHLLEFILTISKFIIKLLKTHLIHPQHSTLQHQTKSPEYDLNSIKSTAGNSSQRKKVEVKDIFEAISNDLASKDQVAIRKIEKIVNQKLKGARERKGNFLKNQGSGIISKGKRGKRVKFAKNVESQDQMSVKWNTKVKAVLVFQ